jgi:hypothetical protein
MIDDLSIDSIIWAFGHRIIIEPSAHLSLGDAQLSAPGQWVRVNVPLTK